MPNLPGLAPALSIALFLSACASEAPPEAGRAEIGATYRYELYTHCGLDTVRIVFDGSEWRVEGDIGGANPPPGFGNPFDEGRITLETANRGVYVSSQGEERTIVCLGP